MRAAIYTRVSTTKEEQEHGLKAQAHACRKLLEERKIPIEGTRIYEEKASGRKAEGQRGKLRELLHDAAMKRFQVLVVFRLDRLTRGGISEMFRVLNALRGHGVRVYSVSETWWDPGAPTSELVLAVLAWAAEFESRSIGERVAAGIASRRAEAENKGEAFLWGKARVSRLLEDPRLPEKVLELRAQGRTWGEISRILEAPKGTVRAWARNALRSSKVS